MSILVVDDSPQQQGILRHILTGAKLAPVLVASTALEALETLERGSRNGCVDVDLILMDVMMPEVDGIEACRRINRSPSFQDIPIMMVTSSSELEKLDSAFAAGAMDYIVKPVQRVELLARARSLLKLKREVDARKARERELVGLAAQLANANEVLQRLSLLDGLTGIPNRRHFDEVLEREWQRAARGDHPVGLLMADIDHFKRLNDTLGHQEGDECLRRVAGAISAQLRRGGDLVARYGGEEFAVVLPETALEGAAAFGEVLRLTVVDLRISHPASPVGQWVTVSLGAAASVPAPGSAAGELVAAADRALYEAKRMGRNRVLCCPPSSG